MEYKFDNGACIPLRVHTVVMSAQHKQFENDLDVVHHDLREKVIKAVIPQHLLDDQTMYYLNPCGNNICNYVNSIIYAYIVNHVQDLFISADQCVMQV